MFTRFVPGLVGRIVHCQEETVEVDQEEGTHDVEEAAPVEVPDQPPVGQEEVMREPDIEVECRDYGYVLDDDEEEEGEEGVATEHHDLGPEDGEDPVDHDVELYDTEGYGLL
jgi:hypothetical protein